MSGRTDEEDDEEIYFPKELEEFYEDKRVKLGSGAFSKVLLAEHKGTKEMVAVKVMNKDRLKKKNNLHRFRCEVEALKTLVHQNICQLYQVSENDDYVSLVMEHCPGGELFDYIVSKKKLPENMLLNNKKSIKLIDFGLSVKPASGLSVPLLTRVGSPAYAAPELVSGELYFGDQTDIWSLGVLLYAVLCGRLPFDEDTTPKLYELIKKGVYYQPKHLSKGSARLLRRMMEVNPKKRITMKELIEDDWLTSDSQLPVVTSESTLPVSVIDENIASEVAEALALRSEEVRRRIEMREYDDIMAYYLLLVKKKENDIRKFQLIYRLSTQDMERLHLLGSSNSNLTSRQRSHTERICLTKMMDDLGSDDEDSLEEFDKKTGPRKTSHFSLPRRKTSSLETGSSKPFLSINERVQSNVSFESTRHDFDAINSRSSPTIESKQRSGSKINEFMSAVFKLEEKPRKVKGFYHMENTSTKSAEAIRSEVARVLGELVSNSLIKKVNNPKRFLFRCLAFDKNEEKMSFQLEICAIPKVGNVFGILNKRFHGDIWLYKGLVEQVFKMIKL